jgi:DNA-damage-inducible protein J
MAQTTLSIRMDEDIKKRFDTFCSEAGMNTSVAVNMFARTVLREQRIPFEIIGSDEPFYSIKNQTRLRESINQLESGKGTEHDLIEADDV